MIYFVTNRIYSNELQQEYQFITLDKVKQLIKSPYKLQLDVETSMEPDGPSQHQRRELYVLQLGTLDRKTQIVFDMVEVSDDVKDFLYDLLSDSQSIFLGHNIRFEFNVIKAYFGIDLQNMHDTFLMSKILMTGINTPPGFHSLAGLVKKILGITMSKESQTSFNGSLLTDVQIKYAAYDVDIVMPLYNKLNSQLLIQELDLVYDLERKVIAPLASMEFNRMRLDIPYWKNLADTILLQRNNLEIELNEMVLADTNLIKMLKSIKLDGKVIVAPQDEYFINWKSASFRDFILRYLLPTLPFTVRLKPDVKSWYKNNADDLPEEEALLFQQYLNGDYDTLSMYVMDTFHNELKDNGYYASEGDLTVNWNSTVDKLIIFRFYYPSLKDTNAGSLSRIKKNTLITKFKEFTKASKMASTYGLGFLTKYVTEDGLISPNKLQQILNTGRLSFGILLQMPGNSLFRNGFLPPIGYKFVDTDYSSMEVLIMATKANESAFLDAVRAGKDLHSYSASLMFGDAWIDAAEEGCIQLKTGERCECKEHNRLRTVSKSITFGLAYGMSAIGLIDRLNITKEEAIENMDKFFSTFPNLKKMFETDAQAGVNNLYSVGMKPLKRKRFFSYPENRGERGVIERASKNFGIQSANADILKMALIKVYKRIREDNLPVLLHLPVHDEILSSARADFAEEWKTIQEQIMIESTSMYLDTSLVTVDSKILDKWEK